MLEKLKRKLCICVARLQLEQVDLAMQKRSNDRFARKFFIRREDRHEKIDAREAAEQLHKMLNERNVANQELQEELNGFNYQIVQVYQEIEEAKARIKCLDDPKVRK